jgi:hypothetical protein
VLGYENFGSIIGLGIGIDNRFDISTWSFQNKYVEYVEFILMCDKIPLKTFPMIDRRKISTKFGYQYIYY